MTGFVLQSTAGSATMLSLLTFLGILVSVVLSVVILVKGVQGYRQTGDAALPGLAAGILLLSGAPLLLNVLLTSLTGTGLETVTVLTDLTQLLGLALITYVIYETGP